MERKIRIGVLGVFRGMTFAKNAASTNMKLVAICDSQEEKLRGADVGDDVARYTDYAEFLKHDFITVLIVPLDDFFLVGRSFLHGHRVEWRRVNLRFGLFDTAREAKGYQGCQCKNLKFFHNKKELV